MVKYFLRLVRLTAPDGETFLRTIEKDVHLIREVDFEKKNSNC